MTGPSQKEKEFVYRQSFLISDILRGKLPEGITQKQIDEILSRDKSAREAFNIPPFDAKDMSRWLIFIPPKGYVGGAIPVYNVGDTGVQFSLDLALPYDSSGIKGSKLKNTEIDKDTDMPPYSENVLNDCKEYGVSPIIPGKGVVCVSVSRAAQFLNYYCNSKSKNASEKGNIGFDAFRLPTHEETLSESIITKRIMDLYY